MLHVVGMAEMKLADREGDLIRTYALGSCLGIAIHDPVAHVGGLLHVMMPLSESDPERAGENPYMFVDTGVPLFFRRCYALGAEKSRLHVTVAGGASLQEDVTRDIFQIGKRNFVVLRKLLWKNGILLERFDTGGSHSRTMTLEIGSGRVTVQAQGQLTDLRPAEAVAF